MWCVVVLLTMATSLLPGSIMGEGAEVGIVPRFSQELFDRVEGNMSQLVRGSK